MQKLFSLMAGRLASSGSQDQPCPPAGFGHTQVRVHAGRTGLADTSAGPLPWCRSALSARPSWPTVRPVVRLSTAAASPASTTGSRPKPVTACCRSPALAAGCPVFDAAQRQRLNASLAKHRQDVELTCGRVSMVGPCDEDKTSYPPLRPAGVSLSPEDAGL